MKGKPTKRIVRTLTTEYAGGNRLTYEKELLNSGKNSHFYKTNHLGFPHALPPYDNKGRVSLRAHMQFVLSPSFNSNVNYAAAYYGRRGCLLHPLILGWLLKFAII